MTWHTGTDHHRHSILYHVRKPNKRMGVEVAAWDFWYRNPKTFTPRNVFDTYPGDLFNRYIMLRRGMRGKFGKVLVVKKQISDTIKYSEGRWV